MALQQQQQQPVRSLELDIAYLSYAQLDSPAGREPLTLYLSIVEEENNEESSDESEPEAPASRRSSRNPVAPQRLNLFTKEQAYVRTEHAMVTGSDFGNLGKGSPGGCGIYACRSRHLRRSDEWTGCSTLESEHER